MKNFSVVITTRQRKQLLSNLLKSIKDKTNNLDNIEVHVNYDLDDNETIKFINKEYCKDHCATSFHGRSRSIWMHKDYINWCIFNFCSGKYVLSLNDDVIFKTKDWDNLAYNKLEEYNKQFNDDIVYGMTEDCETISKSGAAPWIKGKFSCFPVLSRKAIDVLGFMFDNEFASWNADIAIADVFIAIDRICDIRNELVVEHLSTHRGLRPVDDFNKRMKEECQKGPHVRAFFERNVECLTKYIKGIHG